MRRLTRTSLWVLLLCFLPALAWAQAPALTELSEATVELDRPWETIDVAIALDTSGSMQGLIDAARLHLWEIVHDLTLMEPTPRLRVALLTYGNGTSDAKTGWVRLETDFT